MLVAPGDGDATAMLVASHDRPRRVLFVSYSGVLGGAERVLLDAVTRSSGR